MHETCTQHFPPRNCAECAEIVQDGSFVYVKIHLKTDQGVKNFTNEEATKIAGEDPDHNVRDLFDAIERKDYPTWTAYLQVMKPEEAENYRWNIFDMTKVWPHKDYPLRQFGKLTLDRNVGALPQTLSKYLD
ncbi:MAG: hypothetical protein CL912_29570 [Deltaproteobacteria bacterium]|nr:hypothetical protein [Deltaproteobacteria bacterium]